jgi:hypothetical protein
VSALFVRTDLERAARLTARELHRHPDGDPELAISLAVATVAEDGFEYFDIFAVKDILRFVLGTADVDDILKQALGAMQP